jgi:hypothetical protein
MEIPEIKSVHLDYIRYPDVILPIQLQPTYDIVQDREFPEYDYCYCDACRSKFRDLHGEDPMDLEKPEDHEAWNRFRYNQITHLVNEIAISVRNRLLNTIQTICLNSMTEIEFRVRRMLRICRPETGLMYTPKR